MSIRYALHSKFGFQVGDPFAEGSRRLSCTRLQSDMPFINILLLNQHAVGRANLLVSSKHQPAQPFSEGIAYLILT
jgi:hypothetical protein